MMQMRETDGSPGGLRIEVSVAGQRLCLFEGLKEVASYPISTSKFGLGSEEGSNKTPLGQLEIGEKLGGGAAPRTIFKSREPVGVFDPEQPTEGTTCQRE